MVFVSLGVKAAFHTAKKLLKNEADEHAIVKLDFRNAFNSVRINRMLEGACHLAPGYTH